MWVPGAGHPHFTKSTTHELAEALRGVGCQIVDEHEVAFGPRYA